MSLIAQIETVTGLEASVERTLDLVGVFVFAVSGSLLAVRKDRLVATCRARRWPFFDDPANLDPRFARSRWRKLMSALAAEGLTAERLAALSVRAQRAEDALASRAAGSGGEFLARPRRHRGGVRHRRRRGDHRPPRRRDAKPASAHGPESRGTKCLVR